MIIYAHYSMALYSEKGNILIEALESVVNQNPEGKWVTINDLHLLSSLEPTTIFYLIKKFQKFSADPKLKFVVSAESKIRKRNAKQIKVYFIKSKYSMISKSNKQEVPT